MPQPWEITLILWFWRAEPGTEEIGFGYFFLSVRPHKMKNVPIKMSYLTILCADLPWTSAFIGLKKKQVCRRLFLFSEDMSGTLQNGMENSFVN